MMILALDLGKYKSVSCLYDTTSQSTTYGKVNTQPQAIHNLLAQVSPDRLVIETGTPAGWIHDMCLSLALECQVANPQDERWHWSRVKTKTDRTDALKLAKLSAMDELPVVTVAPKATRQLKTLVRYRSKLIQRRVQMQNTLRGLFDTQGITIPVGAKAWSLEGRALLRQDAGPFEELQSDETWRGILLLELSAYDAIQTQIKQVEKQLEKQARTCPKTQRLQTIPGVGPRLSQALVCVIGDPHRFKSSKQVSSYVGMTPRVYQSGNMLRLGRISKRGDRMLRSLLVEVAWISQRYNPTFSGLYEHLVGGSKTRRKKAAVALGRRILAISWSMLKHETDWDASRVGPGLPHGVQSLAI